MISLRLTNWLWIVLLLGASAMLYHTSYRVQDLTQQLKRIHVAQRAELEAIHVLEAEWSYLTTPERLQKLSAKYLPLKPVAVAQIIQSASISKKIPRYDPSLLDDNILALADVPQSKPATAPALHRDGLTHTAAVGTDGR